MNNQSIVEGVAQKVLDKLNSKKSSANHGIDPITIIMIIGIILTVIRIIQECRNNDEDESLNETQHMLYQIHDLSIKRTWLNRLRLGRVIRKNLSSDQYDEYGYNLRESIMDVGEEVTEEETYALMEAVNND